MILVHLSLACVIALLTFGDQAYLARPRRSWSEIATYALLYGIAVYLLTASALAALAVAACFAFGRLLATRHLQRRGPDLWSALALLAPPYVGAWLAWAVLRPTPTPAALHAIIAVWQRLTLAAGADPGATEHALILVGAYAFCTGSATFLTRSLLGMYAPQIGAFRAYPTAAAEIAAASDAAADGLARAGLLIGTLERLLVLSLALTGNLTAIGFVVAAKSIARFDLVRKRGEYFVVGTLCSVGIALAVGLLARAALRG